MAEVNINTNGCFGTICGPFLANEELFTKIQEQCSNTIQYISKLGIHYVGNYDLDLEGQREGRDYIILLNDVDFQIGKTRILELEDVQITSLKFSEDVNDSFYIDYQYE